MNIKFHEITEVKESRSFLKNVKQTLSTKKGATAQKVVQMLDSEESRQLNNDKNYTKKVVNLIKENNSQLYQSLDSISSNFYIGSIGNVHQAYCNNGEVIAIKTLRENIKEKITRDLNSSNFIINSISSFVRTDKFDNLNNFTKRFIQGIEEECDLNKEKASFYKLKDKLIDNQLLRPAPILEDLCTKDILCSKWINDIGVECLKDLENNKKRILETELADFFVKSPLIEGNIFEDTNLNNFIFDGQHLFLIDFGKINYLRLNFRIGFSVLLKSVKENSEVSYIDIFEYMGFNRELLMPISKYLPEISIILLQPFLSKNLEDLNAWSPGKRLKTLLGDDVWMLRSSSPYDFFSLSRSLFGLFKIFNILESKFSFYDIGTCIINEYETDISSIKLGNTNPTKSILPRKSLQIEIYKDDKRKVLLKLPSHILLNIEEYLSDDIKTMISNHGVNLTKVIQRAIVKKRNEIFRLKDNNDEFIITLIDS